MDELEKMIDKYDNTTISGMSIKDQTLVFNFLKELQMYRRVGTLNDVYDVYGIKGNNAEATLSPVGEYAMKFAENHGMSLSDAINQPMVKAYASCIASGMLKSAT